MEAIQFFATVSSVLYRAYQILSGLKVALYFHAAQHRDDTTAGDVLSYEAQMPNLWEYQNDRNLKKKFCSFINLTTLGIALKVMFLEKTNIPHLKKVQLRPKSLHLSKFNHQNEKQKTVSNLLFVKLYQFKSWYILLQRRNVEQYHDFTSIVINNFNAILLIDLYISEISVARQRNIL